MGNQQPLNGGPPPSNNDGKQNQPPSAYGGGGGTTITSNNVAAGAASLAPFAHGYSYPGTTTTGGGGGAATHAAAAGGGTSVLNRSPSDTSMTILDHPDSSSTSTGGRPMEVEHWLDDDTVPTVFRWEHGGRQVYITGTFNGWSRQIPMHRSGNDFTYIHNLKRGKHAFKFIVDDEWRFAPDQPTVADIEGRINNFIDVSDFEPYTGDVDFEKEKAAAEYGCWEEEKEETTTTTTTSTTEVFGHAMPDLDEYTREPPPLPPHLRHIILNKPPQLSDTAALPVPQHVALNHLYCTAIKDNMMVLGITQRYQTKFVTTVYYSPCSTTTTTPTTTSK